MAFPLRLDVAVLHVADVGRQCAKRRVRHAPRHAVAGAELRGIDNMEREGACYPVAVDADAGILRRDGRAALLVALLVAARVRLAVVGEHLGVVALRDRHRLARHVDQAAVAEAAGAFERELGKEGGAAVGELVALQVEDRNTHGTGGFIGLVDHVVGREAELAVGAGMRRRREACAQRGQAARTGRGVGDCRRRRGGCAVPSQGIGQCRARGVVESRIAAQAVLGAEAGQCLFRAGVQRARLRKDRLLGQLLERALRERQQRAVVEHAAGTELLHLAELREGRERQPAELAVVVELRALDGIQHALREADLFAACRGRRSRRRARWRGGRRCGAGAGGQPVVAQEAQVARGVQQR